jgi:hypothetical protein
MVVIDRPSDRQRKSRKKNGVYIYRCVFAASTRREREKKGKGEKMKKAVPILPPSRESEETMEEFSRQWCLLLCYY